MLTPLAVREAVSLEGVRARAVQVYWFLRARARQWPAQSPVAPKKARVLGWDIVVDGLLRDSSDDGVRSMIVLLGGVVKLGIVLANVRDIRLSGLLLLSGMRNNVILIPWMLTKISPLRRATAKHVGGETGQHGSFIARVE